MMRRAGWRVSLTVLVLALSVQAEDPLNGETVAAGEHEALTATLTPQRVAQAQPGSVPPPPPEVVVEAQTLLTDLGYEPGPVNGVWNERTKQAYRKFLRDKALPAGETLTPAVLETLRALAKFGSGPGGGAARPSAKATRPATLHRAAKAGNLEGLNAALAAGADVNARDGQGWTALMHAVNKGYLLLVEPLLAAKADPDVRAPDGATALFMAVVHGQPEIIALLIKAGADVSIKGPKGKTAVDVARMSGDSAIRDALGVLEAGDMFRDCDACPEMVVVPAGTYMMGSPASEKGRDDNEGPVHQVTIAQPFAVGKYEVTRGEYGRFVSATGHSTGNSCKIYEDGAWKSRSGRDWRNPGYEQTAEHPVVCVNWKDAQAYVRWLSDQTGEGYRLLSEAEWEYVARAGTTTAWYWGESETGQCRYANGGDQTAKSHNDGWTVAACDDGHYQTAPVGSYEANAFGLYDVLGNVWEWTGDCWNKSYAGAPSNGGAWEGGKCTRRVLRGGSWYSEPRYLRSAYRYRFTPRFRIYYLGFRLARTLTS